MHVVSDIAELRSTVSAARESGSRVGLVPTMGALHAGHISLVEQARKQADFVILTIFVNPTQFGAGEDLDRYPRPHEADLKACEDAGVDLVFAPLAKEIYPEGYLTYVEVDDLSGTLEGAVRPTHFRGVATVVLKLFNLVQPDFACFGEKDFQQFTLIRKMCQDLNVPVDIIGVPTVREPDGLAMSSRNSYLESAEREAAIVLYQSLQHARDLVANGEQNLDVIQSAMYRMLSSNPLLKPDYAVIVDPLTLAPLSEVQAEMVALVAARVGKTRLIDNLRIE